jgi:hypothetical protein
MRLSETVVNCLLDQDEGRTQAIENILPILFEENGIEDVKIFQAFYDPSCFIGFNITVVLSPYVNIAFIAGAYAWCDIEVILNSYKEYKRYIGPLPVWREMLTRNFEPDKRWLHWFELSDALVSEFTEAVDEISIGGMRDIFTPYHWGEIGDENTLMQYGRYFETPRFSHCFYFMRRFVNLSIFEQRDHFRYFMFLLLFMKAHSRDSLAQNIIALVLDAYKSDF